MLISRRSESRTWGSRPAVRACWGSLFVCLAGTAGCAASKAESPEFTDIGRVHASSEPPPGIELPVAVGDLEAIAERGRLLRAMDRSLALATVEMERVGVAPGDIVLPLVDVDDGSKSGQVVFVRWPADAAAQGQELEAHRAERWLMVSLLLQPDRVLDVELLGSQQLAPESAPAVRVERLLAAARHLQSTGEAFHLFSVQERTPGAKPGQLPRLLTRVYALAANAAGPDYEIVVDQPRRAKVPEVIGMDLIHPAGIFARDPVPLDLPGPAPATVTRILQSPPETPAVVVQNAAGRRWTISTQDGRIVRDDDAERPY